MTAALLSVNGTTDVSYSRNLGVDWSPVTLPFNGYGCHWAFGNGKWLSVKAHQPAGASNEAAVGTDLLTWTTVTLPGTEVWGKLVFMLGAFHLYGDTTTYYRSVDGVIWTTHTLPTLNSIYSLLAANTGIALLVESTLALTTNVYSTTDGVNWALAGTHTMSTTSVRRAMFWTGSAFSMFLSSTTTNDSRLAQTVNGTSWTNGPIIAFGASFYAADSARGIAVNSQAAGAYLFTGDNPAPSEITKPASYVYGAYVYGGRIYTSGANGYIDYTDDGVTWLSSRPSLYYSPINMVMGELPANRIISLLTLSDSVIATIKQQASILSGLTFSSSAQAHPWFHATYFDGMQMASSVTGKQALSAYIFDTLNISTGTGGIAIIDGARIVLTEPIQYGVNAASGALTRYQGFGFTQYARSGQELYGAKADGIYRIRGGDDAGVAIAATIDFGESLLDTARLKSINALYFGADTDGAMYVRLRADGVEHTYPVVPKGGNARATPGRGMEGRAWQVLLEVEDATHLDLDMVEIRLGASARRLKGRT
jgi:hypothetical protein